MNYDDEIAFSDALDDFKQDIESYFAYCHDGQYKDAIILIGDELDDDVYPFDIDETLLDDLHQCIDDLSFKRYDDARHDNHQLKLDLIEYDGDELIP